MSRSLPSLLLLTGLLLLGLPGVTDADKDDKIWVHFVSPRDGQEAIGEIVLEADVLAAGQVRDVVFFVDGQYYALNDYCPHMGASLGLGDVRNLNVICDRHGWAFRLADGQGIDAPDLKADTFETRVRDAEVQVRLG